MLLTHVDLIEKLLQYNGKEREKDISLKGTVILIFMCASPLVVYERRHL